MEARESRTFIKVHDGMPDHPKVDGLSDAAFRLLIETWCWSSRHSTDGHVPADAGLVHPQDDGSVIVHDYLRPVRTGSRVPVPDEVRFAVYNRDGWACVTCGATSPLSLDHIWPWSLGGDDIAENLQTLCISCNCRKGARV